ncbi:hypothetical protein BK126_26255 [Paenibacillus sp. FSL H7-0326]|uniref:hypothetical protein n=1 Tax=Paenibacillus sp. FSL H7-0326 TaxID=1921144 RepID=UPI00096D418F|nr:hypothetical protein [Paenibacillus sp. FSL H7-0326]OMC63698.1 hypothetical protein BK126_26255 [Paenibacillus sp. FSL H7-0326]
MSKSYGFNVKSKQTQVVGVLPPDLMKEYFPSCSDSNVYLTPRRIRHIKKKHAKDLLCFGKHIPDMIVRPDYVGRSDEENLKNKEHIELYLLPNLILPIHQINGRLIIASFYHLDNHEYRLKERLDDNRISTYSDVEIPSLLYA